MRTSYSIFKPHEYNLHLAFDSQHLSIKARAEITGTKSGRPSSRIVLHQKNLKVTGASLIEISKLGEQERLVSRVIHHRGFEEVRLHSPKPLYPGAYRLLLNYQIVCRSKEDLEMLRKKATTFAAHPEGTKTSELKDLLPIQSGDETTTRYTVEIV